MQSRHISREVCSVPVYYGGLALYTMSCPVELADTVGHVSLAGHTVTLGGVYFASNISLWSRCHLLARNNADHSTVARLHFFSKRFGGPRLCEPVDVVKHYCTFCFMFYFFFDTLQVFKHGQVIAITTITRPQPSQHYSSQVLHRSYCRDSRQHCHTWLLFREYTWTGQSVFFLSRDLA